nr:hypothetical protein GCM10010200_090050 [Actinomadura rugatobispora]
MNAVPMGRPYSGQRLASSVSDTNIVVLDPGSATEPPSSGGSPMRPGRYLPCSLPATRRTEPVDTVSGSVYEDPATGLTVLCTRSGAGALAVHGRELVMVPRTVYRLRADNVRKQ